MKAYKHFRRLNDGKLVSSYMNDHRRITYNETGTMETSRDKRFHGIYCYMDIPDTERIYGNTLSIWEQEYKQIELWEVEATEKTEFYYTEFYYVVLSGTACFEKIKLVQLIKILPTTF